MTNDDDYYEQRIGEPGRLIDAHPIKTKRNGMATSIDIWLVENKALMKAVYKSLGATFSVELDGACGKKGIGVGPHIRAAFQDAVEKYNKSDCWHYSSSLTKCDSGTDDYGCSWSIHYYKCNDCGVTYAK